MSWNRTITSNTITNDSIITAAEDQVFSELADELVILDLKVGVYYGLNSVGARVWKLIQQPKTVRDITRVIVSEYEVELAQCEHDLRSLLKDLAAKGLINIRNEL